MASESSQLHSYVYTSHTGIFKIISGYLVFIYNTNNDLLYSYTWIFMYIVQKVDYMNL